LCWEKKRATSLSPSLMAYKIMLGDARLFLHGWVSKWDNIIWMAIGYLMHTTCFILDQIINIGLHIEKRKIETNLHLLKQGSPILEVMKACNNCLHLSKSVKQPLTPSEELKCLDHD